MFDYMCFWWECYTLSGPKERLVFEFKDNVKCLLSEVLNYFLNKDVCAVVVELMNYITCN